MKTRNYENQFKVPYIHILDIRKHQEQKTGNMNGMENENGMEMNNPEGMVLKS